MMALIGWFFAVCDRALRAWSPERYLLCPAVELALIATLFMVAVLVFMRHFGLCGMLREARRQMLADVYQLLLYRRCLRLLVRSELRLAWGNIRYLVLLGPTLLFGGVLFGAMYNAMADRYGCMPLRVGQDVVIRSRCLSGTASDLAQADVHADERLLPITAQVHSQAAGTVWTRLRCMRAGVWPVALGPDGGHWASVNVQVFDRPPRPWQYVGDVEVHIAYPRAKWWGMAHGWLIYFLLICLVVARPVLLLTGVRL
jgi:hypothetical protein